MQETTTRGSVRARRVWLLGAAAAVIAAGLTTHLVGSGPVAGLLGDALYAVMLYLVLAFLLPRSRALVIGACALALCAVVELFQLTGLPSLWANTFWPVRLVLGAGFDPLDLIAYALGAGLTTAGDLVLARQRRSV